MLWRKSGVRRGRRRAVVGATRVNFSGRGESHERVTGEWRALDVENMEMQRRANEWAVDTRDWDMEVNIISSDRQCECLTEVREECGQMIKSKVDTHG
jgi:hypothetical protein